MAEATQQPIRQRQVTLDNVSWTPIYVSAHSQRVILRNRGTDIIHYRTDDTNAASQDDLLPDAEKPIPVFASPNTPIGYAKTDGTTGPLLVEEIVPR